MSTPWRPGTGVVAHDRLDACDSGRPGPGPESMFARSTGLAVGARLDQPGSQPGDDGLLGEFPDLEAVRCSPGSEGFPDGRVPVLRRAAPTPLLRSPSFAPDEVRRHREQCLVG